jgi:glyoxylase-like metal-dependent hydrolase (beta-lactamase superfamily II)
MHPVVSPPLLDRRTVLSGLAGMAALCSVGSVPRRAWAAHGFTVGTFSVTVISDGTLSLPVSFVLPQADRKDVEGLLGTGAALEAALKSEVNVALVKAGEATVLIDTGAGPDFMSGLGKHADALEAAGIASDSVTHVVFTHAHADHLWGVIDPLDGGTRFPKARHLMTAIERDFWSAADAETRVPEAMRGMAIGTGRRLNTLADSIESIPPGTEIVPGLAIVDTAGHTPGHVSVRLQSGGSTLLIGGDVLTHRTVSFERPEWGWGADMDSDKAIASRRRTLDMLANERIPLLGYHLPWPGLGRVERQGTAYRFVAGA